MKKKNTVPQYTKESREARYLRVTSGEQFRSTVYADKTKYRRNEKHKKRGECYV